jgi:hypothetical protein
MKARMFVRIRCSSRGDAKELALRLQADGYRVTRRWKLVIVGTDTTENAAWLAERLHLEVLPDGRAADMTRSLRARQATSAP